MRFWAATLLLAVYIVVPSSSCHVSLFPNLFSSFARRLGKAAPDDSRNEIPYINVPGQRFTATHGINAKEGEHKLFLFVVQEENVNYVAISANVAVAGTEGGPEKYEMYLRYMAPPTKDKWDFKAEVTASESYVAPNLYSRDIRINRPEPGSYYLLIIAKENFQELLVTAIVDTPPESDEDKDGPSFTIQRMGEPSMKRRMGSWYK